MDLVHFSLCLVYKLLNFGEFPNPARFIMVKSTKSFNRTFTSLQEVIVSNLDL